MSLWSKTKKPTYLNASDMSKLRATDGGWVLRHNKGNGRYWDESIIAVSKMATIYPDEVDFYQDKYAAYCGPWGKGSYVHGVDYEDTMKIYPGVFPKQTVFSWKWPNDTPQSGVFGYNHIDVGEYSAQNVPNPPAPMKVKNILALREVVSFSMHDMSSPNSGGVLKEYWLTSSGTDNGSHVLEVGCHLYATQSTIDFVNGLIPVGTYVDQQGASWQVVTTLGDVPYIQFLPVDRTRRSYDINNKHQLQYLISQGLVTGEEWIHGVAVGVEPQGGSGKMTVHDYDVTFTGGETAIVPSTITGLSNNTPGSQSVQLTFSNGTNTDGYLYRLNGTTIKPLAANKIVTGLGPGTAYTIEVAGYNGDQRSAAWSNAINITTDFVAATLPAGAVYQNADFSGLTPVQSTRLTNNVTSPALTTTGAKWTEDSTANEKQLTRSITGISLPSGNHQMSMYIKRNTGTPSMVFALYASDFSSAIGRNYNAGSHTDGGAFSYGSLFSASSNLIIADAGAGWWKVTLPFTTSAPVTSINVRLSMTDNSLSLGYTGTSTSALALWGFDIR